MHQFGDVAPLASQHVCAVELLGALSGEASAAVFPHPHSAQESWQAQKQTLWTSDSAAITLGKRDCEALTQSCIKIKAAVLQKIGTSSVASGQFWILCGLELASTVREPKKIGAGVCTKATSAANCQPWCRLWHSDDGGEDTWIQRDFPDTYLTLPGGRADDGDGGDLKRTALREASEEISMDFRSFPMELVHESISHRRMAGENFLVVVHDASTLAAQTVVHTSGAHSAAVHSHHHLHHHHHSHKQDQDMYANKRAPNMHQ
jgi:8-oxo-dGTP pyrophosphatase MutT (NUDIX family)